eukprot:scaffold98883_cov21-Tisochrysis_lutea.AAC.1
MSGAAAPAVPAVNLCWLLLLGLLAVVVQEDLLHQLLLLLQCDRHLELLGLGLCSCIRGGLGRWHGRAKDRAACCDTVIRHAVLGWGGAAAAVC